MQSHSQSTGARPRNRYMLPSPATEEAAGSNRQAAGSDREAARRDGGAVRGDGEAARSDRDALQGDREALRRDQKSSKKRSWESMEFPDPSEPRITYLLDRSVRGQGPVDRVHRESNSQHGGVDDFDGTGDQDKAGDDEQCDNNRNEGPFLNGAPDEPRGHAESLRQCDGDSDTEEASVEYMEICGLLQPRNGGDNPDWKPDGGDGPRGRAVPRYEAGPIQAARARLRARFRNPDRASNGEGPRRENGLEDIPRAEPSLGDGPSRENFFEVGHGVEPHLGDVARLENVFAGGRAVDSRLGHGPGRENVFEGGEPSLGGVARRDDPPESGNHDEMDVEPSPQDKFIVKDWDWDDWEWYDDGSDEETDEEDEEDDEEGLRDEDPSPEDADPMRASPSKSSPVGCTPFTSSAETAHMTSGPIPDGGPKRSGESFGKKAWDVASTSGGYREPPASSSDEEEEVNDSGRNFSLLLYPEAGASATGEMDESSSKSPSFEKEGERLEELLQALLDGRERPKKQ